MTKIIGPIKVSGQIIYEPDFKYSSNGTALYRFKVKDSKDGNEYTCKAFKDYAEKLNEQKWKNDDFVVVEGRHEKNDFTTREKDPESEGKDEILLNSIKRWETDGTSIDEFIKMAEASIETIGKRMDKGLELMNSVPPEDERRIKWGMQYNALWDLHHRLMICQNILTHQCRPLDDPGSKNRLILQYDDKENVYGGE